MKTSQTTQISESRRTEIYERLKAMKILLQKTKDLIEKGVHCKYSSESTEEITHNIRRHNSIDPGADEVICEINSKIAKTEIKEIQDIEDALKRLEKGTYGYCENCEEPIPEARLEARPQARFCLQCEQVIESANKRLRKSFIENLDTGFIYKRDYSKKGFQ